ncbi:hypothetical protein TWF696_009386 [Orbilia brochopaga]|uniref:Uncharacterized protein n=1 Tax=Orbilia brochopaga TaxID=3140254 RepID=A0AAV9UFK6_9PEZI
MADQAVATGMSVDACVPTTAESVLTPFADIFNISAHDYAMFKDAEKALEKARQELQRCKTARADFPAAYERAYNQHKNAKHKYDDAAKQTKKTSSPLNTLFYSLGCMMAEARTKAVPSHHAVPTTSALEKIAHEKISEFREQQSGDMKVLEARIQGLESELKKSNENTDRLIKSLQEHQKAIQSLQQSLQEEQRKHADDISSILQNMASHMAHLENLDKLTSTLDNKLLDLQEPLKTSISQIATFATQADSSRKEIADVRKQFVRLEEMIDQNRGALKNAEKAFDKIYERLEAIENRPAALQSHRRDSPGPASHEDSESLPKDCVSSNNLQQLTSDSVVQQAVQPWEEGVSSRLQDFEDNMKRYFSNQLAPISSANRATVPKIQEIQDKVKLLERVVSVDGCNQDNAVMKAAFDSLQHKMAAIEGQIRGFIMTMQHLNKKFDDQSVDEIILKVNMSLRNLSNKTLVSMGSQVQDILRTLEKLEILDKRITAIERSVYAPRPQEPMSVSAG